MLDRHAPPVRLCNRSRNDQAQPHPAVCGPLAVHRILDPELCETAGLRPADGHDAARLRRRCYSVAEEVEDGLPDLHVMNARLKVGPFRAHDRNFGASCLGSGKANNVSDKLRDTLNAAFIAAATKRAQPPDEFGEVVRLSRNQRRSFLDVCRTRIWSLSCLDERPSFDCDCA